MILTLPDYSKTTKFLDSNRENIIKELITLQSIETAITRNDNFLVKDRLTQSVFENLLCKYQKKAHPQNHIKSYDLKHNNNKISIKSGIVKDNKLTISYSRTTAQKTLDDKINYLSSFENLIIGISHEKLKTYNKNILSKHKYYLYYFPANFISFQSMDWETKNQSFIGEDKKNNILVTINKNMSDQPWIKIPTHLITHEPLMMSAVFQHNNRKYLIIENCLTKERHYYDLYKYRNELINLKGLKQDSSLNSILNIVN